MLRYLVALLLVAFAMLAIRRLLRAREGGGATAGRPTANWPWLLVPVVIAVLLVVGFAYRNWALGR